MLQNSARVIALEWDKDNEFLCILQVKKLKTNRLK